MKQHITGEQLNGLSKRGKKNLGKWVDNKSYWIYEPNKELTDKFKTERPILTGKLPLLSIGQMIEFLEDHNADWINRLYWVSRGDTPFPEIVKGYGDKEFCDALWEAVKEVLENE